MRETQLREAQCWCDSPDVLMDFEVTERHDGRVIAVEEHGALEAETGRYWYTVVYRNVPVGKRETLIEDMGIYWPPDCWYYGSYEDHAVELLGGHVAVHMCVVVLVAGLRPFRVDVIRDAAEQGVRFGKTVIVTGCPQHVSEGGDLRFGQIARWVQNKIAFIDAVGRVNGDRMELKRGRFGYEGMLELLGRQFGSVAKELATEMALAKQMADEADGLLSGGFAPTLKENEQSKEVIYVREED